MCFEQKLFIFKWCKTWMHNTHYTHTHTHTQCQNGYEKWKKWDYKQKFECKMSNAILKRTLIKGTIDSFYCVWTLWYFIFKSVVWLVEGLSLKHNYKMIKKSSLKHLNIIILGFYFSFSWFQWKNHHVCLQWVKIIIVTCMTSYKQSNLHLLWIVGDGCIFIVFLCTLW